MPKYVVSRPIEGITLNGNEYLLDDVGKVRTFDLVQELLDLEQVDERSLRMTLVMRPDGASVRPWCATARSTESIHSS